MTFHLDPPVTPSPTHAWRHSGDSAGEVLPSRAHVIFHMYYGFTNLRICPLPPPLLRHPADTQLRIKLPPAVRAAAARALGKKKEDAPNASVK